MRNLYVRNVDDLIYQKIRLLSIGLGMKMPVLLAKMVEDWYEKSDIPEKDKLRKMKRFVKKLKIGGKSNE